MPRRPGPRGWQIGTRPKGRCAVSEGDSALNALEVGAHTRALEAIGGVPRLIVPDNTKTAVIKASLYEPSVNRTYCEMAAHYDTAILPTRPRRPRDKAKVEAGVLIMERWILGRFLSGDSLRRTRSGRGNAEGGKPAERG